MLPELQQYVRDRIKIDPAGCWIWQLSLDRDGYGYGCFRQRKRKAHRLSYEAFKGPIPQELQIDHLCRVRNCTNPDHLEAVSCGENVRRGQSGGKPRSICKRKHSFADHGYLTKSGLKRCRECDRIRGRQDYARHREAVCAKQRQKYHQRKEV